MPFSKARHKFKQLAIYIPKVQQPPDESRTPERSSTDENDLVQTWSEFTDWIF
jgi:hypothetical protein